jgi:hypothetical protein
MKTKEMIETLRYKANNIKAKIEPEFFNEVADRLEELEEYKELEEQNLLLKLPCKVGDEVYWLHDDYEGGSCVKSKQVVGVGIDKDGFLISTDESDLECWERPDDSPWCILSKEKAEQELEIMVNNMITQEQIDLIERMHEVCTEHFCLLTYRTKEEARDYINRNIDEYKSLSNTK